MEFRDESITAETIATLVDNGPKGWVSIVELCYIHRLILCSSPCVVPVEFSIRNYSLTNVARFVLHVTSGFAGPHPDP